MGIGKVVVDVGKRLDVKDRNDVGESMELVMV